MTRNLPWLVELMPQMFVEMSEELAAEMEIKNGELVTVESKRGSIQAVGHRHQALQAVPAGRQDRASDRHALALGLPGPVRGRQRQQAQPARG